MRWSQKAKDMELASISIDQQALPHKPGEQHHSKGTYYGHSERSNLSLALRWSNP